HLGQQHHAGADHLRDAGGDLPDHLQHGAWLAQRQSGAAQSVPAESSEPLADPGAPAHTQRAAVLLGGLRIASGLALIGAVVAEFVAGTGGTGAGLAYQILQAGFQLNIPRLFAALFLIALTGVLLFSLMAALARVSLGHWHESEQG